MKRFILQQNVTRFERLLQCETNPRAKTILGELLIDARRELAILNADQSGLGPQRPSIIGRNFEVIGLRLKLQKAFQHSPDALLLISPNPGLHIIDATPALLSATLKKPEGVIGARLFDAFPDNPDFPDADGVANLFSIMKAAAETGRPGILKQQRYDVTDGKGNFIEKTWKSDTIPLFDRNGRLAYLLNRVQQINGSVSLH